MRRLLSDANAWSRRTDLLLVILAVVGIGMHAGIEATRMMRPEAHLREKLAAARRTHDCFEAIRIHRIGAPATTDQENDPEASGLIGQEFTLTTTDRGVLEAKLTSVNPNFAAVFVQYFYQLNLKPGDPIALALTGSFPALNIAALAAAEEMKLRPIAITSVGASMWGANDPGFSWLDMEKLLADRGLLSTRSAAASLGGSNDRGRGMSPRGRSLLKETIERNGVELISYPTLDQSISRRMEIYDREAGERPIKAFVNIGGGAAAMGTQQSANLIHPGVNKTLRRYNWTQRGVLHLMAKRGVPVVHVLNVEGVARAEGLPVVPERVPEVGEGNIYFREIYDLRIAIPAFVVYLVLCFGVLRARHRAARAARVVPVEEVAPIRGEPIGERSGG